MVISTGFKIIKIILIVIFSALVIFQVYYRITYGSMFVYTENNRLNPEFEVSSYEVELFLDDKLLTKYTLKNDEMFPRELILKKTFGKYSLKIHSEDNDIMKEIIIYNFLVKWVNISVNEDDIYINTSIFPSIVQ